MNTNYTELQTINKFTDIIFMPDGCVLAEFDGLWVFALADTIPPG